MKDFVKDVLNLLFIGYLSRDVEYVFGYKGFGVQGRGLGCRCKFWSYGIFLVFKIYSWLKLYWKWVWIIQGESWGIEFFLINRGRKMRRVE